MLPEVLFLLSPMLLAELSWPMAALKMNPDCYSTQCALVMDGEVRDANTSCPQHNWLANGLFTCGGHLHSQRYVKRFSTKLHDHVLPQLMLCSFNCGIETSLPSTVRSRVVSGMMVLLQEKVAPPTSSIRRGAWSRIAITFVTANSGNGYVYAQEYM